MTGVSKTAINHLGTASPHPDVAGYIYISSAGYRSPHLGCSVLGMESRETLGKLYNLLLAGQFTVTASCSPSPGTLVIAQCAATHPLIHSSSHTIYTLSTHYLHIIYISTQSQEEKSAEW